ncbi:helix-turn-helix transcriptional regulator [Sulfitobacter sp. S190]|uniref:helix-turn-helix transcriptional regulator n=1 Tax=Sulfitobacter sp. S190 TaxID=2867022 RepID=UPI0021A5DA6B|nr:helix-turn-helix transcriptional regulator [Sulfitobacter sp. S190]UWR21210.1 helix-turn-helix transcriptional regulator [Sulfitobacter sp. S190]
MAAIPPTPEELSDLIGLVYDSAFEQAQWHAFMTRICEMFPGVAAMVHGTIGDQQTVKFASAEISQTLSRKPLQLTYAINGMPAAQAMPLTPNGFVARSKKFVVESEWRSSPMYIEFLQPAGLCHSIHIKLDHYADRVAFMSFGIPEDPKLEAALHDPLFELLKLLAPHASRAGQLARALALAKKFTEVFSGFMDGIILPMLVTDVRGKFLFGNAAGRRLLERGDPFHKSADGRLRLDDEYATADLVQKLMQTSRDMVQSGLRVDTQDAPLLLAISPFRPSMRDASAVDRHLLDEERMFAIFVGQSEQDAVNAPLLEDVFDLSKREAAVCQGLLTGESAASIAQTSGRAPKTVRNQIQMIYEKVGVSSNTELLDRLSVFRTVGMMFEDQTTGPPDGSTQRLEHDQHRKR